MKQLGVLDTAFINLEHANTPQHVGGLGIYDPSTAPGGVVRFKGVIANFERRLQKHPMFRSRLVKVPGNVDRPYWMQDANFDVEFHIRHIALPQPGDWRQLCILVARLHARPLDMSRPLWEAYIIEGLDNIPGVPKGGFGIYTKVHHALVDGAGDSSIMSVIHDLEPDPAAVPQAEFVLTNEVLPNALYLMSSAALNNLKGTVKLLKGSAGIVRDLGKMAIGMAQNKIPVPAVSFPRTRFNSPVGPYRVFEATEFPLADIKAIKDLGEVKFNDVVLAIISGGVRKYLKHHNELPDASLAVSIPLNKHHRRVLNDEKAEQSAVVMDLHTNIGDPLQCLRKLCTSAQEAKVYGENSPLVDVLGLAGVMSPAIMRPLVNTYVNRELTQYLPSGISSLASSVAGPTFPVYSAGAQMLRYYGLGLLTPGVGLSHLIFSSNGVVTLSIVGDRESLADPAFYRECLEQSFAELLAAVRDQVTLGVKASPPAKKRAISAKPRSKAKPAKRSAMPAVKKPIAKKAKSAASQATAKPAVLKTKTASVSTSPKGGANVVPISQPIS